MALAVSEVHDEAVEFRDEILLWVRRGFVEDGYSDGYEDPVDGGEKTGSG